MREALRLNVQQPRAKLSLELHRGRDASSRDPSLPQRERVKGLQAVDRRRPRPLGSEPRLDAVAGPRPPRGSECAAPRCDSPKSPRKITSLGSRVQISHATSSARAGGLQDSLKRTEKASAAPFRPSIAASGLPFQLLDTRQDRNKDSQPVKVPLPRRRGQPGPTEQSGSSGCQFGCRCFSPRS